MQTEQQSWPNSGTWDEMTTRLYIESVMKFQQSQSVDDKAQF